MHQQVYEGEQRREEFSPLNKTSSTLHGGGTALHTHTHTGGSQDFCVFGEKSGESERERRAAKIPHALFAAVTKTLEFPEPSASTRQVTATDIQHKMF
jgi:hypothetical protein